MQSSFHSLSPESTVTSLLSSSGHLTSLLQPSALSSSFTYKDQEYESASAALDAYITDFELSRRGNVALGAGLVLPSSSFNRTSLSMLRNRDVLRERLSERELDFLSLPVSSLHHRSNRDRVSMTTDELLNLPNDGSEPITHMSAFIHGLMSKSRASQHRSPVKHTCSQSHAPRASQPIRTLCCSRCGGEAGTKGETHFSNTLTTHPRLAPSVPCPDWLSSRDTHLPHWLSSNKATLGCSDIHSLPDLPYPPWIRQCHTGQLEGSVNYDQSERNINNGQSEDANIKNFPPSTPSWIHDLDDDQQENSELTLRTLRFQLAQHMSSVTSERTSSGHSLHTDQRMEDLIQKADRVLDSLQNSTKGSPPVSQDRTEDLLLQHLHPSLNSAAQFRLHSPDSTTRSQPGPLEAVKQILFRLQAVERELQRRHGGQQGAQQERQRGQQGENNLQGALQDNNLQGALQDNNLQGALQEVREEVQWRSLQERDTGQQGVLQELTEEVQWRSLQDRHTGQQGALQERQSGQQGALQENNLQGALQGNNLQRALQEVREEVQWRSLQDRHTGQQGALQELTEEVQWWSLQEKVKENEQTQVCGNLRTNSEQKRTLFENPEADDGGPSLERALHHLSRLKLLVERPHRLQRDQEDEGRFSSSSTDGL